MTDRSHVSIETLEKAFELLITHVRETKGSSLLLEKDYYWAIPPEQLYDVYHQPSRLTIGQLSECLDHLQAMIDAPTGTVSYGLVWLGDLLRATGHLLVE
ncbi:hypothetical protein G1H10_31945 [Phytoactinopolyspora halotolerans]|uniref:Uncharacterized protein n=2 Tax=Phytoactinopolyspora halotolerans TaxID=1981512 RepID=A0A6L9SJD3_9ACTN|nr:hypothetical protein [Phytoactinopolyspora halotolerans]